MRIVQNKSIAKSLAFCCIFSLLGRQNVNAQTVRDTVGLVKEFNRVMSFAAKPHVHFRSQLSVSGGPGIKPADAGPRHGEFYKVGDDLYYGNEEQEVFLQDSLMITIDHSRHAIQVSKVEVSTKSKLDLLPLGRSHLQKLFREHYTIRRDTVNGDTAVFLVRSQEGRDFMGSSTQLKVFYSRSTLRPYNLEATLFFQQPATAEALQLLGQRGINGEKLVQVRNGTRWLVLSEMMSMQVLDMNEDEQVAEQMPLWTQKIDYDAAGQVFHGKGALADYEVIKTF
jgi:hypothetical protein